MFGRGSGLQLSYFYYNSDCVISDGVKRSSNTKNSQAELSHQGM